MHVDQFAPDPDDLAMAALAAARCECAKPIFVDDGNGLECVRCGNAGL